MSKSKVIWNIALFFVLILSLPFAYAQTAIGSPLIYVIVNAAVIGIVLFILQAMILPNKPDKERVSAWVIVIAASLLIAWLYGRAGYIWEVGPLARFFNWYVLGNTVIIGAVLYFLAGLLLKDKKPQSNEGQTGMIILVIIISLVFAVKIGNKWVWNVENIRLLTAYLFGEHGILNPSWGLWTFLGASVLLAFFFNGFLLKDQKGFINYAMAILIASSMASSGVSIRSVIIMGEVIFTIVLASSLGATAGDMKNPRWLLAILLVGWASAAATYGTEYQGILAWFIGNILYWMGLLSAPTTAAGVTAAAAPSGWSWKWILGAIVLAAILLGGGVATASAGGWGLWAVLGILALLIFLVPGVGFGAFIILGIVIVILFVILRGENRRRVLTLAWAGFKKRVNAILGFAKARRDNPKDREPQFIMENRLLFQALANYTTRSEITYRYWSTVKKAIHVYPHLKIGKFWDQKALRKELIAYRSGGMTSQGIQADGWNQLNLEAVELLNELNVLMFHTFIASEFGFKGGTGPELWQPDVQEFTKLEDKLVTLNRKFDTAKEQYDLRIKAFRDHYVMTAYKGVVLNMSNVTGDVEEHPHKFARRGAEFIGGPEYYGNSFTAGHEIHQEMIMPIHEVNQFGEYVADYTEQKRLTKLGILSPDIRKFKQPRKLKDPRDIVDYPHFVELMDNVGKDWKGLAEDIRYGLHHPMSRTVIEYLAALQKGIDYQWDDDKITFTFPPSFQRYSLDMRALANPGKNVYWGRIKFDAKTDDAAGIPRDNPYPNLSSLGLRDYLSTAMDLDIKDKTIAQQFKEMYPADTGVFEKGDIKKGGARIGMRLSQTPIKSASEGGASAEH